MNHKLSKNVYHLPFTSEFDIRPAPVHYLCDTQINAIDFALEVNTPIFAAGDGLVHKIADGFDEGGFDKEFLDKSNLVMIEHDHGEYSCYVHLLKGVLVNKHQKVKAGQLIAYSGLSGYTAYPHLHFEILMHDQNNIHKKFVTIPARFYLDGQIKVLSSPKE